MIVLHGSAGSPYVARVRMQGYAKDLPIELRPAAPGTPEFRRMNLLGKIPVLEHDGFVLPESQVICEYLEDAFPAPSLLGRTSRDRARVRLVARVVDLYCGGLFGLLRAAVDPSHAIMPERSAPGWTGGSTRSKPSWTRAVTRSRTNSRSPTARWRPGSITAPC